jgi:hypothetical protein
MSSADFNILALGKAEPSAGSPQQCSPQGKKTGYRSGLVLAHAPCQGTSEVLTS